MSFVWFFLSKVSQNVSFSGCIILQFASKSVSGTPRGALGVPGVLSRRYLELFESYIRGISESWLWYSEYDFDDNNP